MAVRLLALFIALFFCASCDMIYTTAFNDDPSGQGDQDGSGDGEDDDNFPFTLISGAKDTSDYPLERYSYFSSERRYLPYTSPEVETFFYIGFDNNYDYSYRHPTEGKVELHSSQFNVGHFNTSATYDNSPFLSLYGRQRERRIQSPTSWQDKNSKMTYLSVFGRYAGSEVKDQVFLETVHPRTRLKWKHPYKLWRPTAIKVDVPTYSESLTKPWDIAPREDAICDNTERGDGTEGNPALVCTAEELIALSSSLPTNRPNFIRLANNIDLGTRTQGIDIPGKPVYFDGADHSLTVSIDSTEDDVYVLKFPYFSFSTVKNLAFVDVNLKGRDRVGALFDQGHHIEVIERVYSLRGSRVGRQMVGAIAAKVYGKVLKGVSNFETDITYEYQYAGGLFGVAYTRGAPRDSSKAFQGWSVVDVSITPTGPIRKKHIGGIAGVLGCSDRGEKSPIKQPSTVLDSDSPCVLVDALVQKTSVTGDDNIGGIAGKLDSFHLNRITLEGSTVSATNGIVGGVVGESIVQNYNDPRDEQSISDSLVKNCEIRSNGILGAGGLIGTGLRGLYLNNTLDNVKINSPNSPVGFFIGYVRVGVPQIRDNTVKGGEYIGKMEGTNMLVGQMGHFFYVYLADYPDVPVYQPEFKDNIVPAGYPEISKHNLP